MTRTIDDANYAANRTPENRRIYAEQEIEWAYAELLKAQHGYHFGMPQRLAHFVTRGVKAELDLAAAHKRHIKACAELGPATLTVTWQHPDGFVVVLRDACGFIRFHGSGYGAAYYAAQDADRAAINLGLEVE